MPRQAVSGTENWRAAGNHANALEKLGFCAYLNRLLTQAKPLTVGPSELTCLEFGSPSATLLRKKTENLGENPPWWRNARAPLRPDAGLVRRAVPPAPARRGPKCVRRAAIPGTQDPTGSPGLQVGLAA